MKRTILLGLLGGAVALVIVGCTRTDPTPKNALDPKASEEAKAKYLLASEPAGAKGVIDIKKEAKDGDQVVVVGRIGGSKEPFTKGRVSFTLVDPSFVPCNEKGEEDSETPWDFC